MKIYPKYQIRLSVEQMAKARTLGPTRIRQLIEKDYEKTIGKTSTENLSRKKVERH